MLVPLSICRVSVPGVASPVIAAWPEGRERQDDDGQDEMARDGEETGVGIQWALLGRQNRRDS